MLQYHQDLERLSLSEIKEDDFTNLDLELEGPPIQIALYFDKGPVAYPQSTKRKSSKTNTPTKMVHLKGFFLLSLPLGSYPKIPLYDTLKFDSMLRQMILEHFPLDHQASAELAEQLSLYPTGHIFLLAPSLKPWSKKTDIFLKGVFLFWSMEDFFTRALASSTPLLTKDHFTDLKRFLINIMSGYYRNTDGIPNLDIPFLNNVLKTWFGIYTELKENVAGFDKYHVDFLKQLISWIRHYKACSLYFGFDWEPCNQPYSQLVNLGGRGVLLELYMLLSATYVDEYIREHVLFKMFSECANLIFSLEYDIFSFKNVEEGKKMCKNVLLRNVLKKGMSLEEALKEHLSVINHEVIALQRMAKGLLLEFGGCEPVQKYVRNTMLFVDGGVRYLASQRRYGMCEYKIMKVRKLYKGKRAV